MSKPKPRKKTVIDDIHFQSEIIDCDLIAPIFKAFSKGSATRQKANASRGVIILVSNFLEDDLKRRHDIIGNAYYMSSTWIAKYFGRNEYDKMMQGESLLNKLFILHTKGESALKSSSPMADKASAWTMTEEFERTLDDLRWVMDFFGNNNATTDKDHIGQNCAVKLAKPKELIIGDNWVNYPVELPNGFISHRIDYLISRNSHHINNGKLDQWYKPCETETNRLYGVGALTLQNKHKEIRNGFFKGKWSVDASCCAQTILNQTYEAQTGLKLETLSMMVNDKRAFRKKLAIEIFGNDEKTSIGLIKDAIMPIAFGGSVYPYNASREEDENEFVLKVVKAYKCSPNSANDVVYRILGNNTYKALVSNLKSIFKAIEFDYPAHRETRAQQVAYFYQREESKIMEVVREMAGKALELLIHDGIIANKRMNCSKIEREVYKKTGYKMLFEQERL